MVELKIIITDLISQAREWEYWDYKKEWYSSGKNANLVHDILCMVNAKHTSDKYIIIGVDDDGVIVGVGNDTNRKKQHELINTLCSVPFSQDKCPEVEIHSFDIDEKIIDVIVIKNSLLKPFYLIKPYPMGNPLDERNIKPYHIYTRKGCTNTPINSQCEEHEIEHMWRQRFGLELAPFERLKLLLQSPFDWDRSNEKYHFHKQFPEYRIVFNEAQKGEIEPYTYFFLAEGTNYTDVEFYYHSTVIFDDRFIYCDEFRFLIPAPEINRFENYTCYYYYIRNSFKFHILNYLLIKPIDYIPRFSDEIQELFSNRSFRIPPFIIFDTEMDLNEYDSFIKNEDNKILLNSIESEDIPFESEMDKRDVLTNDRIKGMLKAKAIYDYWIKKIIKKY